MMPEANPDGGLSDLRRSTRIPQALPITVAGRDAMGRAFQEHTTTSLISAHGCRFSSKHFLLAGSEVEIEIPPAAAGESPRKVMGRVAWTRSPETLRDLFQVGVEIAEPGNVWGVSFPPQDWDGAGEPAAAPQAPPELEAAGGPALVRPELPGPVESPGDAPEFAPAPAEPVIETELVPSGPQPAPETGSEEEEVPQDLSGELEIFLQQPSAPGAAATPISVPPTAEPGAVTAAASGAGEARPAAQVEQLRAALEELEWQAERIERRLEQVRAAGEEISTSFREGIEKRLAEQTEQFRRQSDETLAGFTASLESALVAAGERSLGRLVAALDQRVEPILEQAGRTLGELESRSRQMAAEWAEKFEARQAATQSLLDKLSESADEVTHKAFESVSHSADWYQRRAQAAMNTALEKHLAEFEAGARSAAGQVVQSFTRELERFRDQFLAQTEQLAREKLQQQWEAVAGEVTQALRAAEDRLEEEAVRRVARFGEKIEERGNTAVEEISRRLTSRIEVLGLALDERAATALDECRQKLEGGLEGVARDMDAQAAALAASLEEKLRAAAAAELARQEESLAAATEAAIAGYRARLENTSSAWMVAAAAQFAEHSRGMMRELAQMAADQVREATATFFRSFAEALARPPKSGTEPAR